MSDAPISRAARNNALWCDAVCCANGGDTQWLPGLWRNRRPSPPFYPGVVTLQPGVVFEPPSAGAVKDSFCTLDLAPLGFVQLFEAQWIWIEPTRAPVTAPQQRLRWSAVRSAGMLSDWEAAWWRSTGMPPTQRLYPPALLDVPGIGFIAGHSGTRIEAGCSVAAGAGVAGIACCFGDPEYGADLVAMLQSSFPGLALAGYDHGAALEAALGCGFEAVGALRVWHKDR